MSDISPERGARNLLANCAHAQAGERLLIAYEPPEYGYFDADAVDVVRTAARELNLFVDTIDVGFNPDKPHLTPALVEKFEQADIILFLARLGDQLRFSDMPDGKKIIVSFALTRELFGSGFSNGHHDAFLEIKEQVNTVLDRAEHVEITCPAGSHVTGRPEMNLTRSGDTSILRFPMSVFTPVPAHSFSGRLALSGFLTGTGSKYYDNYTVEFDDQVFALMQDGRLTGFDGAPADVAKADAHYDYVSGLFGIDRNFVHSWHAGIHPGCGYPWDASENFERWGGAAFGNPRILHFHTCGTYAPGEISWNIIDPSIIVDGVTLWDRGRFHAELLPGGAEILARFPCAAGLFADPDQEIGLQRSA
ncbi:MAG: hypothetical protein GJ676_17945 [Rhodobacteraceae bacterium]|nr:hypothetical protein [Paracoccaceae bacterium]